jgi:hypothetical protein
MEPPRSADWVVDTILHNPSVLEAVKKDPETTLRALAKDATKNLPPPPLVREAGIYYIVVSALGLVALAAIIGAIWITLLLADGASIPIPETVTALGAAAIGALAGLLAPSPTGK